MSFALQLLIGLIPLLALATAVAVRPEPRSRSQAIPRPGQPTSPANRRTTCPAI